MTAVLTAENISFEEKPNQDKKELFFLLSDNYIYKTEPYLRNSTDELTDNQKFFLEESIKKLNGTIESDKEYLKVEMVELPTDKVKDITYDLLTILAYDNIFPEKISTSIEGGICLVFENISNKLFLEIYNDGDIGYIIEDSLQKKLLKNEDLFSLSEASERIIKFYR